jgi:hypothetical protein
VELTLELREPVVQGLCLAGVELWEDGWTADISGVTAELAGVMGKDEVVVCDAVASARIQPSCMSAFRILGSRIVPWGASWILGH